jgi:hypothetical protein
MPLFWASIKVVPQVMTPVLGQGQVFVFSHAPSFYQQNYGTAGPAKK